GMPVNMQEQAHYEDVTKEVMLYFSEKIDLLTKAGVRDILLDPGFGFGKTAKHNFELLGNLDLFRMFERPVMVGVSRKSMISKTLNTTIDNTLNGTTVLNTIALMKGASILRVHDVREAAGAVKL